MDTNQKLENLPRQSSEALSAQEWNQEWKTLQASRRASDNVEFWNSSAKPLKAGEPLDEYVDSFLRLANIRENESVLDMGCGNGSLSIPLGSRGHKVYACDFSAGMIECLKESLRAQGIQGVIPMKLSWADCWEQSGVPSRCVDVALASRSVITSDLEQALMKLDATANRQVCVTLCAGGSPRIDHRAMRALGLKSDPGRDHYYAMKILQASDRQPTLDYITSAKQSRYASVEAAALHYKRMIDDLMASASIQEKQGYYENVYEWLNEHLIKTERADFYSDTVEAAETVKTAELGDCFYRLDEPRLNTWAFISWDVV